MRKFFRKTLIYVLALGMLMPTWLVTGMMSATRAKAADSLPKAVVANDSGIFSNDANLTFNWDSAENGTEIDYYEFWLAKSEANQTHAIDLDPNSSNFWKNIGNITSYTLSDEDALLLEGGYQYYVKVVAHDINGKKPSSTANAWSDGIILDTISPTAKLAYSTQTLTNQDVVATLVPNEDNVTVLNNNGLFAYTFTENGSFTFQFKDEAGNVGQAVATVNNIDKAVPTIDLLGGEEISIPINSEYVEHGFVAEDNIDGVITEDVIVVGVVDTSVLGDNTITYTVEDEAGNVTTVERTVHVVENANTIKIDLGATEKTLQSPDKNLTISGLIAQDSSKPAYITVEKLDGAPADGALAIAVDGFFYEIETTNVAFPVQLEITYSDDATAANYLNENKFASIYYFDGTEWKDYQLDDPNPSTVVIDKENNKITASLMHLTPIVPVVDITAPAAPTNIKSTVSDKTITITWDKVLDAKYYYVYTIAKANGALSLTNTGVKSAEIYTNEYKVNVANYGDYYFVVTSVDEYGNESAIPLEKDQIVVNVAVPVVTQAVATTTTETPVVTAAPAKAKAAPAPLEQKVEVPADDSNGKIKGDETPKDEEDKVNWTPWIVLFVLILLAGAATGGYFYWFNGEEEVKTVVSEPKTLKKEAVAPKRVVKKAKNQKKQKRW